MPKIGKKLDTPKPGLSREPTKLASNPGQLRCWKCPVCRRNHYGFSADVCRNPDCDNFYGR